MAKYATGYFTDDGTFFTAKEQAELHEAKELIRGLLIGKGIHPDPIVALLQEMQKEIEDFYAKDTAEREASALAGHDRAREDNNSATQSSSVETDPSDDEGREAGTESVQQQPRPARKSMSDVGRRKRTKKVQDGRKEHGT